MKKLAARTVLGLVCLLASCIAAGCAHAPSGGGGGAGVPKVDPLAVANALELACHMAPPEVAARPEVENGCATLPEAIRLAMRVGDDVSEHLAAAKSLLGELR